MNSIAESLLEIRDRMAAASSRAKREPNDVQLIAVSKTFPAQAIRDAAESGHRVFGESRLQEAEPKIAELPPNLEWHFIGRVQRNKVRRIMPLFPIIHGIDSIKLAKYTNGVAEDLGLKPKVFLQVNIGREDSKGGFAPEALIEQVADIFSLAHLEILGLMCIPPAGPDAESTRPWFVKLRELRDELEKRDSVSLPSLSMGMSGDFEVAVEEGATHVRVGSAIFGNRDYKVEGEMG